MYILISRKSITQIIYLFRFFPFIYYHLYRIIEMLSTFSIIVFINFLHRISEINYNLSLFVYLSKQNDLHSLCSNTTLNMLN